MKKADYLIPPIIAFTLMTKLPLWQLLPNSVKSIEWTEKQQGLSVLWYPAVGFLLAMLLFAFSLLFSSLPPVLAAILLLVVWVTLTGALHLDGFADSVDAAYAAHRYSSKEEGAKEKILAVFKDPTSGAMAVVALVLLLLLKFSLLKVLFASESVSLFVPLLITLIFARAAAVVFMMITPYVGGGMALILKEYFPVKASIVLASLLAIAFVIFLPLLQGILIPSVITAITLLWRHFWIKKIDGFVGDCVGALIEIVEVTVLFLLCLFLI